MDNEVYRAIGHHEAVDEVVRQLAYIGWRAHRNFVLPDGRIADVFATTEDADFVTIEVKTRVAASLIDDALGKYSRWCNMLWLGFPELTLDQLCQLQQPGSWPSRRDQAGILGIYREGLIGYRSPHMRAMHRDNYERVRQLLTRR